MNKLSDQQVAKFWGVGDFEITGTVVEIDNEGELVYVREDGTGVIYDVDLYDWDRVAENL